MFIIDEVSTPNPHNRHNYMLDTCAINKIDFNALDLMVYSRKLGYRYFITEVQTWELNGFGAKTYYLEGFMAEANRGKQQLEWLEQKRPLFEAIKNKLLVERVSHIANGSLTISWVLDGTVRILNEQSKSGELFRNIRSLNKNNKKYEYDALIAEASIENNCILVTRDKELLLEVNKLFPNNAIEYEAFLCALPNH